MRHLIFAILFLAACASADPVAPPSSPPPAPAVSSDNPMQSAPGYGDAHDHASEAQIRDARRAYRTACTAHQPAGYCECMTSSMAQALSPADVAVATEAWSGRQSGSAEARARVAAARTNAEQACAQLPH